MNGTTIGLQLSQYRYPSSTAGGLFEAVLDRVVAAEAAGFDTLYVMDHLFQLPLIGPPDEEMLEAYTLLGALAARTSSIRLGTLVTGVTYRNPALLAKQVTALDVISGGRAVLGIGAAWFEEEHDALGFRFPPVAERFERLDDALRICRAMFSGGPADVEGTHHSIRGAVNSPRPIQAGGPPVLVGGQGVRKTFALAARHADEININASFVDLPEKLDALDARLDEIGRDRASLHRTNLGTVVIGERHDDAAHALDEWLTSRGLPDAAAIRNDPQRLRQMVPRLYWGDVDEVAEHVASVLELGFDGAVINLVADRYDPDKIALAGEAMRRATETCFGRRNTSRRVPGAVLGPGAVTANPCS